MTAPDLDNLTASPHWEWRPGMRTADGRIVAAVYGGWLTTTASMCGAVSTGLSAARSPENRPDLDHGGTQGEMLPLVRKAWDPKPAWRVVSVTRPGSLRDAAPPKAGEP